MQIQILKHIYWQFTYCTYITLKLKSFKAQYCTINHSFKKYGAICDRVFMNNMYKCTWHLQDWSWISPSNHRFYDKFSKRLHSKPLQKSRNRYKTPPNRYKSPQNRYILEIVTKILIFSFSFWVFTVFQHVCNTLEWHH